MTSECPQLLEIDIGEYVYAVTFTGDDKHLVCASQKSFQVWRVADSKRVAMMQGDAYRVAASRDGRWIAGGTMSGQVLAWDAITYEQVFADRIGSSRISDVEFCPGSSSTRLVSADGSLNAATIWDIAAREKRVQTLNHSDRVISATCSPQGDRIATASQLSVCIWDSNDGRLLVNVKLPADGLIWRNHHLFVITKDNTVRDVDVATGSTISEWPVPDANSRWSMDVPQHARFISYSANDTITFWDTTTHTQFLSIEHTYNIRAIECSSDGQLLALTAARRIIVKDLSSVVSRSLPEPELDIEATTLNAWKHGQLVNAQGLLSAAIPTSVNRHRVLASRALVRVRLGLLDAALVDAEESIGVQQSLVGYIAKSVALVAKGERYICDIASQHFPLEHVILLRLIKAVTLFMAGDYADAISCMDDLIAEAWTYPALYVVQAYIHLFIGNLHTESSNYERAIKSFEDARLALGSGTRQPPVIVSLISGWEFDGIAITIQRRLCEALFAADRAKEAGESALRMADQETNMNAPTKTWFTDFKAKCCRKLVELGDCALKANRYDVAVSRYTVALSLGPVSPQDLLVKRSEAFAENGKWKDALDDANQVISVNSASVLGYEKKYAALLGMGLYDDATDAFETMRSKMSESADPEVRGRSRHYAPPKQTLDAIRASIEKAIFDSPLVLINTSSGRLCNKSEQAAAFESTPACTRLVTSMTTPINHVLVERAVGDFYRYATFSHTWEGKEPLYEQVIKIVVDDLDAFPTNKKLQMFCKIARNEGFIWAWSDTCCIDKRDLVVLQESLVSMFKWYEGSAMTIVFLCDVDQLVKSRWNSRGWTLQEYHASKVVRIYTKDWKPYLGLTVHNHKESPEVISEMEEATGISAQALMALRPGLNDIREKLRLASTRQTTRVEDAAYSLLGIFSLSLPVTYGEGDKALGRLLSQLLTSSGDASILAWTGAPNSFNTCLPTNLAVFSQPSTSHIPTAIPDAEMKTITARLRASSLGLNLVRKLYDRVDELHTPTFVGQRLRLPCLAFKIKSILPVRKGSETVFRLQADTLGPIEIKTEENLVGLHSLYLVHPWISFLLHRQLVKSTTMATTAESADGPAAASHSPSAVSLMQERFNRLWQPFDALLPTSARLNVADNSRITPEVSIRAYEFLARLGRPFGALLLTPTRLNAKEYRRVRTECPIRVQAKESTSAMLDRLMGCVQVLDVL